MRGLLRASVTRRCSSCLGEVSALGAAGHYALAERGRTVCQPVESLEELFGRLNDLLLSNFSGIGRLVARYIELGKRSFD